MTKSKFPVPKVLFGMFAIIILFVVITLFINLSIFDEELSPEVVELIEPIKMPPNQENAYYAIWGMSAASSKKDIVNIGLQLINRYQENRDENDLDEITSSDYIEILGGEGIDDSWVDNYDNCRARTEYGCSTKLRAQIDDLPVQDQRLKLMLERYEQIIEMKKYQSIDHVTFASPLPSYGVLMRLSQIKLANTFNDKDKLRFFEIVSRDITFWKRMLEQGNSLIDKMVAVASIWRDIQTVSEFLKVNDELPPMSDRLLTKTLEPLTDGQLDISESFIFELRAFKNTISTIDIDDLVSFYGITTTPMHWLIQPNASVNDYNQYFTQPVIELSKLPARTFYKTINNLEEGDIECCFKDVDGLVGFSPASLYNIGGKLLLPAMKVEAQDYVARVHDLNGMISLVKLQLDLKRLADTSVQSSIKESQHTNPYTGKPMDYDPKNNWLSFECLDESSKCRIKL